MATQTQSRHRSPAPAAATASHSPQGPSSHFTPEMRDRQARGKNPYVSPSHHDLLDDDSDWDELSEAYGRGGTYGGAPQHQQQPPPPHVRNSDSHHHAAWGRAATYRAAGRSKEDFAEREKKELAMAVLDCPEKLLMYAQAHGDVSVPLLPHPRGAAAFYPS